MSHSLLWLEVSHLDRQTDGPNEIDIHTDRQGHAGTQYTAAAKMRVSRLVWQSADYSRYEYTMNMHSTGPLAEPHLIKKLQLLNRHKRKCFFEQG